MKRIYYKRIYIKEYIYEKNSMRQVKGLFHI